MFTTCNINVLIVLHCHPFKCRHLSQSLSPTNKKDHCRLPSFVEIIVSNAYVHVLIHFHTIQRLYFIQNILYKPLYFFLVSLGELVPKLVPCKNYNFFWVAFKYYKYPILDYIKVYESNFDISQVKYICLKVSLKKV